MESDDRELEVVFEQPEVYLQIFDAEKDILLPGKLFVILKTSGPFIEWRLSKKTAFLWNSDELTEHNKEAKFIEIAIENNKVTSLEKKNPVNFPVGVLKSCKYLPSKCQSSSLIFILDDGTTLPRLYFIERDALSFLTILENFGKIKKSKKEPNLYLFVDPEKEALEKPFKDLDSYKNKQSSFDFFTNTLIGFSKISNAVTGLISPAKGQLSDLPPPPKAVLKCFKDSSSFPDDCQENLNQEFASKVEITSCSPLSETEWRNHFDHLGKINQVNLLREKIFEGGVSNSIRIEVWKFLLGYYNFNSTYEERKELRKQKEADYLRIKLQWQSVSVEQEQRDSVYRTHKYQIDKDAMRIEQMPFLDAETNKNIKAKAFDILMTYCFYNYDLGYSQGMSDLLLPVLIIMKDEVDTFWCFVGLMDRMHKIFEDDSMMAQFQLLFDLLYFVDKKFADYLESHDASDMLFCDAWMFSCFRRAFKFAEVMKLWEILWTDIPCKNFYLFIYLAMIDAEKITIMENRFGRDEITKHFKDMNQKISLEDILTKAKQTYHRLNECPYLSDRYYKITGISRPSKTKTSRTSAE